MELKGLAAPGEALKNKRVVNENVALCTWDMAEGLSPDLGVTVLAGSSNQILQHSININVTLLQVVNVNLCLLDGPIILCLKDMGMTLQTRDSWLMGALG